jgi:solute carrier family 25 (mitochondrial thiamine pyrophosphate transporter), member 19
VKQEGIRALWKGNIPAEVLYVCYGGIQFTSYRAITQLQSQLPQRLPSSAESFVSGASAGAVATTVTYPLDLLRTRFAAQGNERVYAGLAASIRDIARQEGMRGYFRGLSAAIGQIVPYMGLFFTGYEMFHQHLGSRNLPFGTGDASAGVLASIFAKTCVFPLDLVRKRLQVQGPTRAKYIHSNIPEYKGVLRSLYMIFMKEGIRGLYRGLTVSLVKAAPASAVTMWTYERVLHSLMQTAGVDEIWELVPDDDEDEA